jgi:hypothetical protein
MNPFFLYFLFTNSISEGPGFFDPKLFSKIFFPLVIGGSLLLSNSYVSYETYQRIKDKPTLQQRIETAEKLKEDFKKECFASKPLLFGEYLTAKIYLKTHKD